MLLSRALPEVRSVRPPAEELGAAADLIRSRRRKWPYRQLARRAWGRSRPPADDAELWLDAAGAMAATRHHLDTDTRRLAAVAALRRADWAGAVIGLVRAGVAVPATEADLLRYARECPEISSPAEPDGVSDGGGAYDLFAGAPIDDQSLLRAFDAVLICFEAVGAVSDQRWLTSLGWWGLPRALAHAWNGDFDSACWAAAEGDDDADLPEWTWPGREANPAELGIRIPPLVC